MEAVMKNLPGMFALLATTACVALAGCANAPARPPTVADSTAAQLCGGGQINLVSPRAGSQSRVDQHNWCLQEMQGEDRPG
jgi:hypothetical protein